MRHLSAKQKKFLISKVKDNDIKSMNHLSLDDLKLLESMNDYETLYQDTNRFIYDYRIKNIVI